MAAKRKPRAPGTSRARPQRRAPQPPPFLADQALLDEARAAVATQRPDTTVQAARMVRKYTALERDRALLEVRTSDGLVEVLLGRDGSATLFDKK